MTIQEIYDSQPVRKVEYEILDIQFQSEKGIWGWETGKVAIQSLLKIRKAILNEMFELDKHYLQLINDFNEAIKQQMIEMRKRTIALYESVAEAKLPGTIDMMMKENYAYIVLDNAYLAIVPGIAIMLLVLAFMLIGYYATDD